MYTDSFDMTHNLAVSSLERKNSVSTTVGVAKYQESCHFLLVLDKISDRSVLLVRQKYCEGTLGSG